MTTATTEHFTATRTVATPLRLPVIDAARGVAIAAMVVYHSAWDITYFDLAPIDAVGSPLWRNFAHMIAASFLGLVGISLVLADRGGLRARPYLRRLGLLVAAALAVTLATYFTTPDRFIFFGILHCIALSSVLGLLFLRLPAALTAIAGLGVIALPFVYSAPLFDAPWFAWLGLGTVPPDTNDYVPLLPWFGPVLLGMALARAGLPLITGTAAARWRPERPVGHILSWAGRHSLPIYLLHQVVLMSLFWTLAQAIGPNESVQANRIVASCVPSCVANSGNEPSCRAMCSCTVEGLKREHLVQSVAENRITDEQRPRLSVLLRQCRASTYMNDAE